MKRHVFRAIQVFAALLVVACGKSPPAESSAAPAMVEEPSYEPDARAMALSNPPAPVLAAVPEMNPRRGRILFIAKGCVICHRVNGVGGMAAPDLSAAGRADEVNPLEFSARMWRGAPAMAALQTIELGYVIDLDAQDIADIAAFVASPDEQKLLTEDSVSVEMRGWFIDEQYWASGRWEQYRERGQRIPSIATEEE